MTKKEFMTGIDKLTDKGYDYELSDIKAMFDGVEQGQPARWVETCKSMGIMAGKPDPEFIVSQARR